jgi:parvulin-like peptidyl-prolyl isomerase
MPVSNPHRFNRCWIVVAAILLLPVIDRAQGADPPAASEPTRVLASVGDVLITQADVELALGRAGKATEDLQPVPLPVMMSTVDIIARQRQALETLKKQGKRLSDEQIDQWLTNNRPPDSQASAAEALADRAAAARVTVDNYREFLAFRLSWPAYLQTMLSDANIEKHFLNQKSRFDGSRFEIEHVWIPVPPGNSKARTAARAQLTSLRDQITSGGLTFAAAGKQLGGDAGEQAAAPQWLAGNGPLIPRVIDQVLQTPAGSTSDVFDSAQAVHLIRVLQVEPGERTLAQAHDEVRKHMLLYLLDYLARQSQHELPLVWQM